MCDAVLDTVFGRVNLLCSTDKNRRHEERARRIIAETAYKNCVHTCCERVYGRLYAFTDYSRLTFFFFCFTPFLSLLTDKKILLLFFFFQHVVRVFLFLLYGGSFISDDIIALASRRVRNVSDSSITKSMTTGNSDEK